MMIDNLPFGSPMDNASNCPLDDKMIQICNATHQHLVQEIVRLSQDLELLQADVNIYKPAFLSLIFVLGCLAIFLLILVGPVKRRSRIKRLLGREEFVKEVSSENRDGVKQSNGLQKHSVCTVASIDDIQERLKEVEEGEDGQRYGARRKVASIDIGSKIKTYEIEETNPDSHHQLAEVIVSPSQQALERVVSKKSLPAKLTDLYQHIPEDYEKDEDKVLSFVPNICITRPSIDSRASTNVGMDERRTTFAGNTKFDGRKRSISMNN